MGIESHPFVRRVARAKLAYTADAGQFIRRAQAAFEFADLAVARLDRYSTLIRKCFSEDALSRQSNSTALCTPPAPLQHLQRQPLGANRHHVEELRKEQPD